MLRKADVARLGSERLQRVGIFHDDDLTVKVGLNVTIERPDNAFRWPAIGLCGLVRWPIGDERRVEHDESREAYSQTAHRPANPLLRLYLKATVNKHHHLWDSARLIHRDVLAFPN